MGASLTQRAESWNSFIKGCINLSSLSNIAASISRLVENHAKKEDRYFRNDIWRQRSLQKFEVGKVLSAFLGSGISRYAGSIPVRELESAQVKKAALKSVGVPERKIKVTCVRGIYEGK